MYANYRENDGADFILYFILFYFILFYFILFYFILFYFILFFFFIFLFFVSMRVTITNNTGQKIWRDNGKICEKQVSFLILSKCLIL